MNQLFCNSLIASAVAITGIVTDANHAIAIPIFSDPIEFSVTIPQVCTFGTPTPGTLVEASSPSETRLASFSAGGLAGVDASIELSCNTGASIEIKELQELVTNGMTRVDTGENIAPNVVVFSTNLSTGLRDDGTKEAPIELTEAFSETLRVVMSIRYNEPILNPGIYIYRTVLTATPN